MEELKTFSKKLYFYIERDLCKSEDWLIWWYENVSNWPGVHIDFDFLPNTGDFIDIEYLLENVNISESIKNELIDIQFFLEVERRIICKDYIRIDLKLP